MRDIVLHIYDFLSSHRRIAAAILLVVLALCVLSALRLDFAEDISDFLPREEKEQLEQSQAVEKMAVIVIGGSEDERAAVLEPFMEKWPGNGPGGALDYFKNNLPYLLAEEDYARIDSLLSDGNYIPERLKEDKLALYASPFQSQLMRLDPLGLFTPALLRLRDLQPRDCSIHLFDSPYGKSESARNAALVDSLNILKQQLRAEYPSLKIISTGGPEVAVENSKRIKTDSFLAIAIAALLICIVLWFSYKRLSDVTWILISIVSGAIFALGIIACFKSSISIIVLGIGCTIIGIAVNYPLHYVDHLKYQKDKRLTLAQQVNPLLIGNITTVGAFLGMLLLNADALHDFGFIGAMMLVGTILFTLIFLPVFITKAKKERNTLKLDLDRYVKEPGIKGRKVSVAIFVLLTVFLLFMGRKVGFDTDLHNINYMTAEQAEGFSFLELPQLNDDLSLWVAFLQKHSALSDKLIDEGLKEGFTAHAFQPFFDILDTDYPSRENPANALAKSLSQDFDTIGILCSLIVFFFLWLSFGSLETAILCFLPLAVSWFWIQGIMGVAGLQFNIVNIILASFIFGQGDDYSIFITEGLLYERATGKKILHSFKNAVVLSALIMFIGIGVLALAKHPAMRSLGLVTVIGMLTVVAMAFYLPPLVFRWLTTRKGSPRKAPITVWGLVKTAYISLQMVLWMTGLSILALFFPKGEAFHKVICKVASWAIHSVPGCRYKVYNPHGEDFSKPAVYVCNHQSHLDVLALIALHPKLIFMTNNWVWRFPFYGAVIRKAGYFPASWGLSTSSAHIKEVLSKGYSVVIFPEGTRSIDGSIQRFHRGAFLAAQEMGIDVLPLCIHGFHDALPKHDFLLRKAGLSLEIGKRVSVPKGDDLAQFTRDMRHFYDNWYESIRRSRENAAYCAPFVKLQYLYKGNGALAECRKVLTKETFRKIDALHGDSLEIRNAGYGVEALLTAMTHPGMKIMAYEADEDKYLTAKRSAAVAENLEYIKG